MTQPTPTIMDRVAAALTDDFESSRAIWLRVDCWSPISVRNILPMLVDAGRAESKTVPMRGPPGQYMRLFRRTQRSG